MSFKSILPAFIIKVMKYAAVLRGIGPGNPNMRNEKLRGVFEELGHKKVHSVISSGNIVFENDSTDVEAMEAQLEAAWQEKLGFTSTTMVRSQEELEKLMKLNPFKKLTHSSKSYLLVTFFKRATKIDFKLPHQPEGKTYQLTGKADRVLFTVTDNTEVPTTDLMAWLERQFGKEISSRTWLTVNRILKKMKSL